MEISDNRERGRFEAVVEGQVAFVTYRREAGRLVLLHAEVPGALEGRGVGSAMVRAVLDEARREGVRVVPVCPFVGAVIRRDPAYADLAG